MRILSKLVSSRMFLFIGFLILLIYTWLMEFHTKVYSQIMQDDKKTILVWTANCYSNSCTPFDMFETGQLKTPPNCPYQNCYIDKRDESFYNIKASKYDAILFHGSSIQYLKSNALPRIRNRNQIYIFVQLRPSDQYPVCQPFFDSFFNWTMTYRLDSDIPWTYIKVKDLKKNIVAPDLYARWLKHLAPTGETIKTVLATKKHLAASLMTSNDEQGSWRFVQLVNRELARRYNQTVDIFGPKGTFYYPGNETEKYNRMLRKHYFFYMLVENSVARDFVTEQVLIPLNNYVVPIVWGMTDYEKFLPPNSYIDARLFNSTKTLVDLMLYLVANRTAYADYFRWRRYYTLHNSRSHAGSACQLCSMLNEEQGLTRADNLRRWWSKGYLANCGSRLAYT